MDGQSDLGQEHEETVEGLKQGRRSLGVQELHERISHTAQSARGQGQGPRGHGRGGEEASRWGEVAFKHRSYPLIGIFQAKLRTRAPQTGDDERSWPGRQGTVVAGQAGRGGMGLALSLRKEKTGVSRRWTSLSICTSRLTLMSASSSADTIEHASSND